MHFLIERFRFLCAWWRWVTRKRRQVAGLEALFSDDARYAEDTAALRAFDRRRETSACPIPLPNCETCRPEPVDHRDVGRGDLRKETIAEVAAWLETEGWAGEDAGRLQVVAAWLIKRREAYERNGAAIS